MRWRLVGSGLIAVALVSAGCGDGGDEAVDAPTSKPNPTSTDSTSTTTTTTTTSATTEATTEPAAEAHRVRAFWSLDPAFPVSDVDTSAHILLRPPSCVGDVERELVPADVEIVGEEIHVAAYVRSIDEPSERVCSERTLPTVVDLGTSIDGRPSVDSACLIGGTRAGNNPREWCVQRP